MQLIPVESGKSQHSGDEHANNALAGMISSMGSASFGREGLVQLNHWMPLCWWSIYTVFEKKPPSLHGHGSYDVPDGTLDSWAVYKNSLYRHDETFHAARDYTEGGRTALVHWVAKEIPAPHRAEIYEKHNLRERLSVVARTPDDGLFAVNLYRENAQPAFTDAAIDGVRHVASLLMACVQRHVVLMTPAFAGCSPLDQLPRREKEVCERLLKGWTQDGIAADLGLTPSTVKTYRNRAFASLNIHTRHELSALVSGFPRSLGRDTLG